VGVIFYSERCENGEIWSDVEHAESYGADDLQPFTHGDGRRSG